MQLNSLSILLWAVVPPLLLLWYYCRRLAVTSYLRPLIFFGVGAIVGLTALGWQWGFETLADSALPWDKITRSLAGVALRQLIAIGPIEEGCKLAGVVLTTATLQRWRRFRSPGSTTIFIDAIATAFGFTAEENWVYFHHGTASVLDRLIGTPVHAMFSAPWGYTLAMYATSNYRLSKHWGIILTAWLNAVVCHALVNTFSIAGGYPPPLRFLSYLMFPLLLWMFWRLQQLSQRAQGQLPITLISGYTRTHRNWQRGLVFFALMLGGNAIFGIFLLVRYLTPLSWWQIIQPDFLRLLASRVMMDVIYGAIALAIYLYLRRVARRRQG